jgi:hypothetical protein
MRCRASGGTLSREVFASREKVLEFMRTPGPDGGENLGGGGIREHLAGDRSISSFAVQHGSQAQSS